MTLVTPKTTRSASVLLAALLLSASPALPFAQAAEPPAQAAGGVQLPDTAPARCAQAFIAMINAGNPDASRAFETKWASKARLGVASMDERAARGPKLKSEFAPASITKVLASSDDSISVEVKVSGGRIAEMEFNFDAAEPGKLNAVMIKSEGPGVESLPINAEQRARIVQGAARALQDEYVYPEVADKMAKSVLAKLKGGEYDAITDEAALTRRLTEDLRAVSQDKHLRVALAPRSESSKDGEEHVGMPPIDMMRRDNYAFKKVEILPGNIGYLRFDLFVNDKEAEKTATAAFAFLKNCDALIFDLRSNGGGDPAMIRFLTSYLFDEPTHLNDMIDRDGKVVEEFWTNATVPGRRFDADLPVYVLTSSRTFSGAEEFSYNLKNLNRATLIGETTGGGAHPVKPVRIDDRFVVGVPFMRANNPITKTNWEGSGVTPDIAVKADQALDRAVTEASKAIETGRRKSGK